MSDAFDISRATDRSYSPPPPWTLWHFEKLCWTCMGCEAPAALQLHAPTCWLDDDNSVEDCKNKFSEIRQRELAGVPVFGAVGRSHHDANTSTALSASMTRDADPG